MLLLRQAKHLAERLGATVDQLESITDTASEYCEELLLIDPSRPDKQRTVLNVLGDLRLLQTRLYRRVLLPVLQPSECSHGGVRGRHIKSNANQHIEGAFGFTTDISNFFPSISHNRVERLFRRTFECSPDVSRFCTKLCTFRYHLALGLVTSPILADQIIKQVDRRIAGACEAAGLTYTRFVDDITITGPFDLDDRFGGIADLVVRILGEHGFHIQRTKHVFGQVNRKFNITKLRVRHGHLDVRKEYIDELSRQLDDVHRIARDERPIAGYISESQLRGRIHYACWINPGRKLRLFRQFRSIDWERVYTNAVKQGLVALRKELVPLQGCQRKVAPPSILAYTR